MPENYASGINALGVIRPAMLDRAVRGEIIISTGQNSGLASFAPVDTDYAFINFEGATTSDPASFDTGNHLLRMNLADNNSAEALRADGSAGQQITTFSSVLEFHTSYITSIQRGTITIGSGNTSQTATINAVNTSRSAVVFNGLTCNSSPNANELNTSFGALELTDSTTVTATRGATGDALTIGYTVIEFAQGIVEKIQQVSGTFSNSDLSDNIAISSVETNRSMVLFNGFYFDVNDFAGTSPGYVHLASSTGVNWVRGANSTGTSRTLNVTVIEFAQGIVRQVQRGIADFANVISGDSYDIMIAKVNTRQCWLNFLWWYNNDSVQMRHNWCGVKLLNNETLRALIGRDPNGTTDVRMSWEVIEFM